MAITYISNAVSSTTATTSFSISLPTTQTGDLIILDYTHRATTAVAPGGTSGLTWTLKHTQLYATSTFSGHTYWARATGNHSGQTVTGTGLTNSCAAVVTVYRGVIGTGDPLGGATVVGEQNASGDETQAQITTNINGTFVVLVVVNSPDYAIATQAATIGSLTERAELLCTGGTDTSVAHASIEMPTSGGTGAFTWTQTNAVTGSWAYAIVPSLWGTSATTQDRQTIASSGSVAYTITYNGNNSTGGSVPVDSTLYASGATITVLGNTGNLVRTGYTFIGWSGAP